MHGNNINNPEPPQVVPVPVLGPIPSAPSTTSASTTTDQLLRDQPVVQ